MATKVSTLNKKLPKASQIRWCTGAGKGMSTSIGTDESRKYSRKICFKQGGSTKSNITWQIVYRWRNRYTPSVSKTKKNATWSGWSTWRTPTNCSLYGSDGKKKTYTMNSAVPAYKYWRVGNRGYVTNSSYNVFANWTAANKKARTMKADYDAVEYQFAVRSYHAKTAKHGEWVYQKLKVYRRATVVDEVLHKNGDGGLQIDFNYICERGGSISITGVKTSAGNNILKVNEFKKAPSTDTNRMSDNGDAGLEWYPFKRSGYTAGQIIIPPEKLSRAPKYHEKLTVTGNYVTKDGAKTKLSFYNGGYIYGEAAAKDVPRPRIEASMNENTGVVTIKAYRTSEFDGSYNADLADIQCSGSYVLDGVERTCGCFSVDKVSDSVLNEAWGMSSTNLLCTWKFRPPMNLPVTFSARVKNEFGHFSQEGLEYGTGVYEEDIETKATLTFKSAGYMLNGITYPNVYAAVSYNAEFSTSTETGVMINLPYGRSLPFAVYGVGRVPTLTLKGYSVDNKKYVNKYNSPYHLKRLADYLGLYWLRNGKGETFKVAVKKVDIEYVRYDVLTVTIEMQEVS